MLIGVTNFELKQVETSELAPLVEPILIDNEQIIAVYRDRHNSIAHVGTVFTDLRVINITLSNVAKRHFEIIMYNRLGGFRVEAADTFDKANRLEFVGLSGGTWNKFDFFVGTDITEICKAIGNCILK